MNKAVIVIDMPDKCFQCEFCHGRNYDPYAQHEGTRFCGITNDDVDDFYTYGVGGKPANCPLKQMVVEKRKDEGHFGLWVVILKISTQKVGMPVLMLF